MIRRIALNPRVHTGLILCLLALFVGLGCRHYSDDTGDDLSASYVGCRLIAEGDAVQHLYSHDGQDFAAVGKDEAWQAVADDANFEGWLHPYVQTPLWAWSLQPLCTRLSFPAFDRLFVVGMMLCFAALLWLVTRSWAPRLFTPWAIALVLLALWFSTPFAYAMLLVQTHVLFVLLTVGALLLVERDRPLAGGVLLALAAAVKVTPAVFLLYWLVGRRWRAAAAFTIGSMVLFATAVLATGRPLTTLYLADLARVSHTLLVSQNNQSFAAWVMGRFYPATEITRLRILPLPAGLRVAGTAAVLLSTIVAGVLDRRRRAAVDAPYGALMLLVAVTIFTPIAWTHYSIVLLPALLVAASEALRRRSWGVGLAVALLVAMNLPPLASDVIAGEVGPAAILRGQFFAGVGCICLIIALALRPARMAASHAVMKRIEE